MGCGPFDAARRALLAIRGGAITLEDIEGVLQLATASVPSIDATDPDEGLRRLAAKAQRAKPEPWLFSSAALVQALITFIRGNNMLGIAVSAKLTGRKLAASDQPQPSKKQMDIRTQQEVP
jgi:hypothetical protein